MIVPLLLQIKEHKGPLPMEVFYRYVGLTRQGFYQAKARKESLEETFMDISKEVLLYRINKDRRAGSRSLYYNLDIKNRYNLGVNKFEQLMALHGLTLIPLDIRVITTKSSLQSWNYTNLIRGIKIKSINKVVVGDITYLIIGGKRYYLFCLTDLYSYRIVGYCLSDRMRTIEALITLKMVIKLRGKQSIEGCFHHTDGGGQYFAKKYMEVINSNGLRVSVAKNCLENGYAEQRNGLIKNHLIPTLNASTLTNLKTQLARAIHFYNYERKQESLNWLSPVDFEKENNNDGKKYERTIY